MIDVQQAKQKIINYLSEKGPSIPNRIAKIIEMSPIFTSAILSELIGEKRVKISNIKIGSSPVYLLPGQEADLEAVAIENLTGPKKEAYLKLKENLVLIDKSQPPHIRVALRSIKDFAIPLKLNEDIIWKYLTLENEKVTQILQKRYNIRENKKEETQENLVVENEESKVIPNNNDIQENKEIKQEETQENNEVKQENKEPQETQETNSKEENEDKKIKTASDFLNQIKSFLKKKNIDFLEESSLDKKEIIATARINTLIGQMKFLLIVKNKKKLLEKDIKEAYDKAIKQRLPCILLYYSELTKKTMDYYKEYRDIVKLLKIE
jgi:exonuclease SbcC